MDITEMIKKTLAFGAGAALFSAEKIKQFADDMVARGEMSSDEAKSFVDEISEKAEEQKKSIQEWMNEQMSKMLQQAGVAEAARMKELEVRVDILEKRVTDLSADIVAECPVEESLLE